MARNTMTIRLDTADLDKLCKVHCMALECANNTANRSHGESIGLCNCKHVTGQAGWGVCELLAGR